MSFTVTSPVTGGAQTGLTSPAYVLAADTAPSNTGKQYAVASLTGTQTGVDTSSSPSRPFTATLARPPTLRSLPSLDASGVLRNVPVNVYKIYVRKGVTVLAGQAAQVVSLTLTMSIPAGSDSADTPNIRAAMSLMVGILNQISSSIGDTLVSGVI